MISKINKQLPPIFQLRLEGGELELYTVMNSDIVTVKGKGTRQMKRFKTLCDKKDIDVYLKGMDAVLGLFYLMSKVDDAET